jgi:hypothetical protein
VVAGLVLAGCGSTRTQTVAAPLSTQTTPAPSPAFVSENAATAGPYVSSPTTLSFSVNGDLEAEHVTWSDWGQRVAIGSGTFLYRSYPSNAVAAIPGTVTLSESMTCGGKLYYSAAVVDAPGGPFTPASPTKFRTPC